MRQLVRISILTALAALVSGCASTDLTVGALLPNSAHTSLWGSSPNVPPLSSQMPTGQENAAVPPGFISFCIRFQDQCAAAPGGLALVTLTADNWAVMARANDQTNAAIVPEDDLEHYGRAEFWTIPTDGYGDCDDYAVTKRKALMQAGFPELALRIAIVLTQRGERHAVLTVATDKGDYVLDNLTSEIRTWSDSGYTWIERQASNNPWQWVAFQSDTGNWGTATAIAAR